MEPGDVKLTFSPSSGRLIFRITGCLISDVPRNVSSLALMKCHFAASIG